MGACSYCVVWSRSARETHLYDVGAGPRELTPHDHFFLPVTFCVFIRTTPVVEVEQHYCIHRIGASSPRQSVPSYNKTALEA